MIISRKDFSYHGRTLIEKVRIQLPFRYEVLFQNEGCVLYLKNIQTRILTAQERVNTDGKDAVWLTCGMYFVDWLHHSASKEVEVIVIHLYPDMLRKMYQHGVPDVLSNSNKRIHPVATDQVLDKFIESLEFYFDHPQLVTSDLLELKVQELILLLVQSRSADSIRDVVSGLISPASVSIRKVVQTHLYSNLTIAELARLAGYSLTAFKRAFRDAYNESPRAYINNQKLEKAAHLFQTTQKSVSEVAFEVGFNDPSYFSRLFRRKKGLSPMDFRTQRNQLS